MPFLLPGKKHRSHCWLFVTLFLAGMGWATWQAEERLETRLPPSLEGKKLEVSGYVCGVPEPGSFQSVRFAFCVTRWHTGPGPASDGGLPERLRLAWYGDEASLDVPSRLRLTVVLKKPHGAVNPRGFRYESWLFRHNYGATGTIRAAAENRSVACGLECQYYQWRAAAVSGLTRRLQSVETGPLIASLMLGYRGELEPAHWQVLKATGTIHLVAISGLHLGLVAIGAGFLCRRLLVWLPERWLPPARQRLLLFVLVCLASFGYALAAGFSVPTRRALVMVVLGCCWVFLARRSQAADAVLLALSLVLILDPLSPLDQGFWLSFGAATVLTLTFSGLLRPAPWWRSLMFAQVAVFATLWPILAFLDQSQPLVGFVANLIAIPLVSLLIMPAIFLSALAMMLAPWLDWLLIGGLDLLLQGLWWVLSHAAEIRLPDIVPGLAELFLAALIVPMALILPVRSVRLWTALTLLLWLSAAGGLFDAPAGQANPPVVDAEVWVWDVGQGLSVLVRQADRVLVYDTGPELEGVYSAAESVLVPNLRALGVQRIDTLIISHADNDHSGGVPLLLEQFDVQTIISGEPARMVRRLGPDPETAVRPCDDAADLAVPVTIGWQLAEGETGNDASCVIVMSFNEGRQDLILSGDITRETEQGFLQRHPALMSRRSNYRVVLAPHHGSKTSSSPAWVSQLSPDLVLFSAGYRHRYGHPHPDVVARYREGGSRLFNTATSGAVRLVFNKTGVDIIETRQSAPFWIDRHRAVD
jgi:competence protein ComEC